MLTETEILTEGQPAPDFTLPAADGHPVTLHDFRGKPVVIYFYPADDTPGCTRQACGLRDVYGQITDAGAVVLGISPDTTASHEKFARKYSLPFLLLADPDHAVCEAYGVWKERVYLGKQYMGAERSTFIVAPDGTLRHVWRKVKPDEHADQVLAALAEMPAAAGT